MKCDWIFELLPTDKTRKCEEEANAFYVLKPPFSLTRIYHERIISRCNAHVSGILFVGASYQISKEEAMTWEILNS